MARCQAIERDGTHCRNKVRQGEKFCSVHSGQSLSKTKSGLVSTKISIEEPGPKSIKLAVWLTVLGAVLALMGGVIANVLQNKHDAMLEVTRMAAQASQLEEQIKREDLQRALNWSTNGRTESLRAINLSGQDLTGIDLSGADLRNADFSAAILNRADLSSANLQGADLRYSLLRNAILSQADLSNAELSYAYVNEAYLEKCILYSATLIQTVFQLANLRGCNLSESNLTNANFTGAILERAMLSGSSMLSTNFQGSHMAGATISGGTLIGADLTGADLTDTIFMGGVTWDSSTKWPEGYIPSNDTWRADETATP
jgi:uncharacterized protein YjbI with pentapeptide repeats